MTKQRLLTLDDIPPIVREMNPHLFNRETDAGPKNNAVEREPEENRARTLNKTEARFYGVLKRISANSLIIPQPTRLFRFPAGGTYTPDFLEITEVGLVIAHEVKGGYKGPGWEQGIERFRRAVECFGRWIEFQKHTWNSKQQKWEEEKYEAKKND